MNRVSLVLAGPKLGWNQSFEMSTASVAGCNFKLAASIRSESPIAFQGRIEIDVKQVSMPSLAKRS